MRCFIGIDLGSTTTKAVVMDENLEVLGRGITNSRSNYDTACKVARYEALINTRFTLVHRGLSQLPELEAILEALKDAGTTETIVAFGDIDFPTHVVRRLIRK